MEADILRIILFVAGAALILGIYLADRFKQAGGARSSQIPDEKKEEVVDASPTEEVYQREPLWQEETRQEAVDEPLVYGESALQEPVFQEVAHQELPIVQGALQPAPEEHVESVFEEPLVEEEEVKQEPEPELTEAVPVLGDPIEEDQVEEELKRLGDLINEEREDKAPAVEEEPETEKKEESRSQQFSFRFFGGNDAKEKMEEPQEPELPLKIIQINIVPQEGRFSGDDILCAVSDVNMEYGEWGIYHSYDPASESHKPVFSLASMVEPGAFPSEGMETYSTPGLALFARLPGPKDGLTTFSELLFTAERLATLLEGTLQDETHSDLSKQTIEHMREEIQEYHRQLQLARSR